MWFLHWFSFERVKRHININTTQQKLKSIPLTQGPWRQQHGPISQSDWNSLQTVGYTVETQSIFFHFPSKFPKMLQFHKRLHSGPCVCLRIIINFEQRSGQHVRNLWCGYFYPAEGYVTHQLRIIALMCGSALKTEILLCTMYSWVKWLYKDTALIGPKISMQSLL